MSDVSEGNPKNLEPIHRLTLALVDLRHTVDHLNQLPDIALRGKVFKAIDQADVQSVTIDGWCIGYKMQDHNTYMSRHIFVKCLDAKLDEIPMDELDPVLVTILNVFTEKDAPVKIRFKADDCVEIVQHFIPTILVEKNPNIVPLGGRIN